MNQIPPPIEARIRIPRHPISPSFIRIPLPRPLLPLPPVPLRAPPRESLLPLRILSRRPAQVLPETLLRSAAPRRLRHAPQPGPDAPELRVLLRRRADRRRIS